MHHFKLLIFTIKQFTHGYAEEITEDGTEGYSAKIFLTDYYHEEEAEEILIEKIKKMINVRYLNGEGYTRQIAKDDIIKGKLSGIRTGEEEIYDTRHDILFVIDGKPLTVEELLHLLDPYAGFNFTLKIDDSTEDL